MNLSQYNELQTKYNYLWFHGLQILMQTFLLPQTLRHITPGLLPIQVFPMHYLCKQEEFMSKLRNHYHYHTKQTLR